MMKLWIVVSLLCCAILAEGQQTDKFGNFNLALDAHISHGDILTNDVWGFVDSTGIEYAIVGTRAAAIIYDITTDTIPQVIATIPGTSSIWRDFKTYRNYIYQTTDQGSDGLRIIDMTNAPDTVTSFLWNPEIDLDGSTEALKRCHNIWIDTLSGIAYLAGCNVGAGGSLMLDIATDPLNPIVIGAVDERYAHDVITRGNFLYASEINQGNLGIYDISDLANPILISRTRTTSSFTHNAWFSDDGNFIFTTDERANSFVDAYDISDPTNPRRVDTYQPKADVGIIPHNVHYKDGYIVASWYSEGVIILDAHRPTNLVKVGQYDTAPQLDSGGSGCWGAYPFFPSGKVIASDLDNGFFLLTPTYQRASYLEGIVRDRNSKEVINGAEIILLTHNPIAEQSNAAGLFATGTVESGTIKVAINHPEFFKDTIDVALVNGEVTNVVIDLKKKTTRIFTGLVLDENEIPISAASIELLSSDNKYKSQTNFDGIFSIEIIDESYTFRAAAWGFQGVERTFDNLDEAVTIQLAQGYEDDFFADLGWSVTGDATKGHWERGIPIGTTFGRQQANSDEDVINDIGMSSYITGNAGGSAGQDDVDDGTTLLISPSIPIDAFESPVISFTPWFYVSGGNTPLNDTLKVFLRINETDTLIGTILNETDETGRWRERVEIEFDQKVFDGFEAQDFQIVFSASDLLPNGHIVEAGIDMFRITEGGTTANEEVPDISGDISLYPNPVSDILFFSYEIDLDIREIFVFDILGRSIMDVDKTSKRLDLSGLQEGIYIIEFRTPHFSIAKHFYKL